MITTAASIKAILTPMAISFFTNGIINKINDKSVAPKAYIITATSTKVLLGLGIFAAKMTVPTHIKIKPTKIKIIISELLNS
jgi:hypothetical protein